MQSLRTRKPSERRPKGQGRPANKLARATPPNARKSTRVDDKIRKRMSMRYVDISSPTEASIPAVPALPFSLRPGQPRQQNEGIREEGQQKEDTKVSDLKVLDKDEFDPEAFLKAKMANSTEAELRTLQSSLQGLKDGVQQDLQRNVFKNYAEFVIVSKEVSTLENEMLEFKDSLAEWKGMPSLLHIDDSASVAERRRNVRSSIADLKVLYANQMQNLHTQIEGSSKFVPTTSGRHVITEMDGIFALNAATFRIDHSCRFVLLDDAVLVARRRRRRNNTESEKLIAERCWPLNEMLVLDTKDTSSMTNVFKIRHNKETHVYRTEIAADKKNILAQFRHVAEELAAKRQKEREGEHQRRKSLWVNGASDRSSMAYAATAEVPPMPDFLADLLDKSDFGLGSSAKEKAEHDARWIGEFADELTVAIALRKWSHAVTLVEEGESKLSSMPTLSAKFVPLKSQLTSALLQSLSMPSNRKSNVVQLITLLLRLGAGPAARNTFLSARSDVMRKSIRAITFEGSVGMYIADLAIVVFTGIKHTADWFLASFKENEVASAFIGWAKQQIENFAEMFRKQVYSPDVDAKTVDEAIQVTQIQSKRLLEEFGLDFRFLLEQVLVEIPKEANRPPAFKPHPQKQPSPIYTPASTPVRSRSPAPTISAPTPRSRSPVHAVPPIPQSIISPTPIASQSQPQSQGYGYSPVPSPIPASPLSQRSPSTVRPLPVRPGTPDAIPRGPRTLRGSPAPPPRSRDRPGSSSGHRPPPVAVPKRDGMF